MYYKRNERHWRVAFFFGGAAIAFVVFFRQNERRADPFLAAELSEEFSLGLSDTWMELEDYMGGNICSFLKVSTLLQLSVTVERR